MHRWLVMLICWAGIGLGCRAPAQEDVDPRELMKALPELPEATPRPVQPWNDADLLAFAEGMQVYRRKCLVLPGTVLFDAGPTDGLEVLACLQGGKNHESLLLLDTGNGTALKAACLAWLAIERDGMFVDESSGILPRGTPVRMRLRWCPDPLLAPDKLVEADVSTLVRNRATDRGYPPLPYVYTGSRMERVQVSGSGGEGAVRYVNRFMLDVTKSVAVNFNEPDALIASPFPMAQWDDVFEVNTGNKPPLRDNPAQLCIERVDLPLNVTMGLDGSLQLDGRTLDDDALVQLLRQHYLHGDADTMYAIGVTVTREHDRALDLEVLKRVLRLAVQEQVWVIPVFVL